MKKFFVSYTQADREWAEWIASQIEANGHAVVIQAWHFLPGSRFVSEMHKAVSTTDATIAVLSPDYLESPHCETEWTAAFLRDPRGEKRTLIPIRVRECRPDGLLAQVHEVDLVGVDEATASRRLADLLNASAEPSQNPRFPGSTFPGDQLSKFADAETREIAEKLREDQEQLEELPVAEGDTKVEDVHEILESDDVGVDEPAPAKAAAAAPALVVPDRIAAGDLLTNPTDQSELVHVPGGEFVLGEGVTSRQAQLPPFWIGRFPVTREQYGQFLAATEHPEPVDWGAYSEPDQPVVGVSWHDAMAYCRWAGTLLPTEDQWEAAARGHDGRKYPWGDEEPTYQLANFLGGRKRLARIGLHPEGAGPFGAEDQAGNVWEWCADLDERDENKRFSRGGSWVGPSAHLRCAFHQPWPAHKAASYLGFRIALPASLAWPAKS